MSLPYIRVLDKSIIAFPDKFELAWSDAGSGKPKDYSIWNPIPPPGFVALGCILKFGVNGVNPPTG
jgi:hypothetical protein